MRVGVPDVDRSKTDPRNVLGVVLAVEDGFYRIGTRDGVLEHLYSRNQIEACASNFLHPSEVPTSMTSLRNSVGSQSLSGKQGHVHCNCTRGCNTKRCKCLQLERICNSRCHNSSSCKNKQ